MQTSYIETQNNIAIFQTVTEHVRNYASALLILIPISLLLAEYHPKTEMMTF